MALSTHSYSELVYERIKKEVGFWLPGFGWWNCWCILWHSRMSSFRIWYFLLISVSALFSLGCVDYFRGLYIWVDVCADLLWGFGKIERRIVLQSYIDILGDARATPRSRTRLILLVSIKYFWINYPRRRVPLHVGGREHIRTIECFRVKEVIRGAGKGRGMKELLIRNIGRLSE